LQLITDKLTKLGARNPLCGPSPFSLNYGWIKRMDQTHN